MEETADLQFTWMQEGAAYAQAINDMLAFADEHGWDAWEGEEAQETRGPQAEAVLTLLRGANQAGTTQAFRQQFPPAFVPFAEIAHEQGRYVGQLTPLGGQDLVFMVGAPYESRQAYLLQGGVCQPLSSPGRISAVGKAKKGNVVAVATTEIITVQRGWDGPVLHTFNYPVKTETGITQLLPFNDGQAVLVVSNAGIDLLTPQGVRRLLPTEWDDTNEVQIDMENADLSHDNRLICVGSQDNDHRLLDAHGEVLSGTIGSQSEYPHYCLFSKDDQQLMSNSCHFYNGVSIAVDVTRPELVNIEAYQEENLAAFQVIDRGMRVYAGVSFAGGMILGDASGYVRAYTWHGKLLWRHFLGGTISGMALCDDETTLWVGTYVGALHQLTLGQGQDSHTIGNGNHREDFRLLFWNNEPSVLKW